MKKDLEKPSPEAKALSLFLMAHKTTKPIYKEKSKRIKRLWGLVLSNKISHDEYMEEVISTLESYGGYEKVLEQTVKYYIDKTGKWTLTGDDKYCQDAQLVADKMLSK